MQKCVIPRVFNLVICNTSMILLSNTNQCKYTCIKYSQLANQVHESLFSGPLNCRPATLMETVIKSYLICRAMSEFQ